MNQQHYPYPPPGTADEEINISAFFSNLRSAFFFVLRRWYVLLLFVGILCGLTLLYAWWYGKKYVAHAAFAVEGQATSSSLLSSALSLANALGIQTAQSKNNTYTNNFFAELMISRKVVKEALLRKAAINGKEDVLANHYADIAKLRTGGLLTKGWNANPRLRDFSFQPKPLSQLTPLEDSLLEVVYQTLLDKNLEVVFDESSPFNTATFTSRNADLSRFLLKAILEKTSGYYMENVYELNAKNFRVAEMRVDSLGRELRKLDARVAILRDQANNMIRQQGLIALNDAQREQNLLSTQYAAAVNNLELAKVTILTTAPILQVIDNPQYSLEVSYINKSRALVLAVIIGLILGTIYLIILRAVKLSAERLRQQQELAGADQAAA
ncbi:MAG: hypothetical protein RMK52_04980 [Chitinophagales bacterium]|nr:hypothetical protein [Chitinophagales bacterium]MDW8393580.1 hypothetical protein [Chitinophagales bacterium]